MALLVRSGVIARNLALSKNTVMESLKREVGWACLEVCDAAVDPLSSWGALAQPIRLGSCGC